MERTMQQFETIADKKHLVDSARIARAVDFLASKGVDLELIPIELSRAFYVDLDELNLVLDERRRSARISHQRQAA
jgi:hypothetical protein